MLDRPRWTPLAWAAALLGLFAALAVLQRVAWAPLESLDDLGREAAAWAAGVEPMGQILRVVEDVFGTWAMTAYTAVLAVLLFVRGHRRAALFTAAVMFLAAATTTVTKILVGRARPEWQDAMNLLESNAFPSGHVSSVTALSGICLVLVSMLVRRRSARVLLGTLLLVAVVVVAADRVLLGRHFPTDLVGGALVGAAAVLVVLGLYSPLPRGHADKADPLPEVYTSSRQLHFIVNPIKVDDLADFQQLVTTMALEAGWSEPHWSFTTVEDSGTGMAEEAAVAGADLVIVCGGDGTVREVCAELAGTGIPVGIVPAGTGNLLARNLAIPLFLRAAIDVALNGQDRAIDLARVSGDGIEESHFLVMAGMGFDAAIMEGVNEDIKRRVGWLAYVLSGLMSLLFPAVRFEVSIDDGPATRHRARTVVVGNVGYLQAGMPLLPDATIDDGQLDVVLLHPQRFLSWIPLAVRILARRQRTDDTINRMTGRTVTLRAASDTPRQLDGDSIGPGRELRMECIPGKLLVRVPR